MGRLSGLEQLSERKCGRTIVKSGDIMKKGFIVLLCVVFCIMAGCSAQDAVMQTTVQQKNSEGYVVTELTTAQFDVPNKNENSSVEVIENQSENNEGTLSPSWFDDAVFVGDSVTTFLDTYCEGNADALGQAKFLCSASLSYGNAQWDIDDPDAVHPSYRGEKHLAEDCIAVTGANKIFVMLGINDIGVYGVDGAVENAETFFGKLESKANGAKIYVQSVTPIVKGKENDVISNEKVEQFNERLKQLAQNRGYVYIDVHSAVCDENGYLQYEYCCDPEGEGMGIHFSWDGCEVWSNYLKQNVGN